MLCAYCGTQIPSKSGYCPNCGRPMQRVASQFPWHQLQSAAQARAGLSTEGPRSQAQEAVLLFGNFSGCLAGLAALVLLFVVYIGGWVVSRPLEGQAPSLSLLGHTQEVVAARWSPDGTRIASGGSDNTVRIWDARSGRQLVVHAGSYAHFVTGLAWSPDSKRIASIGPERSVRVWDATTGGNERVLRLPQEPTSLAFSPDGTRLAVSSTGVSPVLIVEIASGNVLYTFKEHTSSVSQVAWSPDGKHIASGSYDETVRVWDPAGKGSTQVYTRNTGKVWFLAWAPDSQQIVSVSGNRSTRSARDSVQVWEVERGRLLSAYQSESGYHVTGVAWSPDGKRIAVSATHDLIQVWHAATGHPIWSYRGLSRSETFTAPDWSPDSSKLVVASSDHTVSIIEPRDIFIGEAYLFDLVDVGMMGAGFLLLLLMLQLPPWSKKVKLGRMVGVGLVIALIVGAFWAIMIVSGWNPLIPSIRTT